MPPAKRKTLRRRKRLSKTKRRRILRILNRYPFQAGGAQESVPKATNPAMVIVEPRAHPKLAPVILNFHERMPMNWKMYIFHGKSHEQFAKDAAAPITGKGREIILLPLETDNLSADEYNAMFNKKSFWDRVNAEEILVFQTDTALCGNPLKRPIDEFLKYDYIGCAYNKNQVGLTDTPWPNEVFYGVGGLSFRKKSFMMKCIDKYGDRPIASYGAGRPYPEDVLWSKCVHESPNKPESGQRIADFCGQNTIDSDRIFGVHKTNSEYRGDRMKLYDVCPEARIIE
jgi:hypothetical protein